MLLDQGAEQSVAVAEVILQRGGVALAGRAHDLSQGDSFDALVGKQPLGGCDYR